MNISMNKNETESSLKSEKSNTSKKKNDRKCSRKMNLTAKYFTYGTGTVLLCLGLIITGFWREFYKHELISKLILTNSSDSQSYSMWIGDTVPIYFRMYLFNWTNPVNSLTGKEKPKMEEIGPFVYRIHVLKNEIIWNKNDTVSFESKRQWNFIPELSNGSLHDEITNINVIAVSLANMCKGCPKWKKILLNGLLKLNERTLYITKTARELLFDGYRDKTLDLASKLKNIIKKLDLLPDKFAWYYEKNVTQTDFFNMYTGKVDINKLGILNSWNYSSTCKAYTGECGKVSGSVGDLWPINIAKQNEAALFIADFCSNFHLYNTGPNFVHDVEGVSFEGTEDTFDNGTKQEGFRCYCPNNACEIKSGVRNATACLKAPVFVSFPHFYNADPSYHDAIVGINPDPSKHKFHITFEKDFGLTLEIFARLQVNVLIEPIEGLDLFANIPRVYLPTLWFEEYIEMPQEIKNQLKYTFNTIPNLLAGVGFVCVVLGALFLVVGLIITRMNYESIPYTGKL